VKARRPGSWCESRPQAKLGAGDRVHLVITAYQAGLFDP
jgi:hypothetical protein